MEGEGGVPASSLTEAQDKALSLLPIFSGLLSAYGSSCIIVSISMGEISRRRRSESDDGDDEQEHSSDESSNSATKTTTLTCYKRIMLGLSCSDGISSLALSLQAFLLPANSSTRVWAVGTDATCGWMGFFQQLSIANIFYNGMLSFYFLATIKYGCSETNIAKRFEPWMHGLAIGFPLVTATTLAALGMYGELQVGHWCWITGNNAALIAYMVAGIPNFFFLIAIPVNNIVVYRHIQQRTTVMGSDDDNGIISTSSSSSSSCNHNDAKKMSTRGTNTSDADSTNNGATPKLSKEPQAGDNRQQQQQQQDERRLRQEEEREQERRQHCRRRKNRHLREVARQAFLYVAAFLICQLPTVVLRILAAAFRVTSADESRFFPLLVVQAIFLPLQGLFNWIIYSTTYYVRETIT